MTERDYQRRVKALMPRSRTGLMCLRAFAVGGGFCCLGELIAQMGRLYLDLDREQAGTVCSLTLIFLAGLLTALGVFDRIASFAGAGTVVPITGFANSIVSPAMEFRAEGLITGTAAKLFQIAGPVLVYGIGSSVVYGLILFFIGCN